MAAGGSPGVITVWNLEERRLQAIVRDAHDGPVVSLHFFAGKHLLETPDWYFCPCLQ